MGDLRRAAVTIDGRESPALCVRALARAYGKSRVVAGFDLEVGRGGRVALVGPNGSGKSTILRIIAGTLTMDAGSVTVLGHAAGTLAARRETGVSFAQDRAFYARLTGRSNLEFFARLRGHPARAARDHVRRLEEELELDEILHRRVGQCSTGMVQQLSYARALVGEPRLVLLDEPTRSLDDAAVERMWRALERRPDTALVIATHRTEDLARCDRVVELTPP